MKRVRLGYLGGFAFVHAIHTDDYLLGPMSTKVRLKPDTTYF